MKSRFEISYDALKQRVRKVGIEQIGSNSDYVDLIQLFNEKIEYRFSDTTKTCEKKALNQEWSDFRNFRIIKKFEFNFLI